MKKIKNNKVDDFIVSFKEIWKYDKRLILIQFSEICISALLPFPNIVLSGKIVDALADGKKLSNVVFFITMLFGINMILSILSIIVKNIRGYLFIKFTQKLNNEISSKCMNIDYEQYNESAFQDRVLLINQIVYGNNFFTSISSVFQIITQIITLIGIVVIMATLNPWILLIGLFVIFLETLLYTIRLRYQRLIRSDYASGQRKIEYVNGLAKNPEAKKDIALFAMEGFILSKIKKFQNIVLSIEKKQTKIGTLIDTGTTALTIAFQIAAYMIMGITAFGGGISIGDFTMGVASLSNFMSCSLFIATRIVDFNENVFYIRNYNSFLNLKSKYNTTGKMRISDIDLSTIEIEFRNVSFRYPNSTNYVLKNINFTLKDKERFGIVGYNGAGKTSLALLLTRMYDPTDGDIYLNGINIKDINYRDYLTLFSTVNQDFFLMAFSMLENVSASEKIEEEDEIKIQRIMITNGLGEKIKKMYRGLRTPVTKKLDPSGVDLSGGERQKLAIVLKNM